MKIKFTLNRQSRTVEAPGDRRVVDLLREDLGLTGTKEGCGSGECGACTILVDGTPRLSCLLRAAQLEGRDILTVEGLAPAVSGDEKGDGPLHPLQEAFIAGGAIQCGFCTPGMLLSAAALLARIPDPGENEIRQAISGHLCRCTGYQKIVESIARAATAMTDDEKRLA